MNHKRVTSAAVYRAIFVRRYPLGWFLLLVFALSLILQSMGAVVLAALRYDRAAVAAGQWWRLLSGNSVHLGWYHLFVNGAALAILVMLRVERVTPAAAVMRWLCLCVGVTLGLYWGWPALSWYVGLSGVIHGLYVLALLPLAARGDWVARVTVALLFVKLVYEAVSGASVSNEAALGGHVVTEAHLMGALTAVLYIAAAGVLKRLSKKFLSGDQVA